MDETEDVAAADVASVQSEGILIRNLSKRFGPVTALNGVDLNVKPGQVVALLGPNGAGKSTLMRTVATVMLPDEGTVRIAGLDAVAQPREARRHVGVTLGDERSWTWRISGRRNLEFYSVLYGLEGAAARQRVTELLETVGLSHAADAWFVTYSTGMRMRLSLARALLPEPPVLLLDEPTRSLDPVAAVAFRNRIRELATSRDMAVLYATHDLHEAAAIADVTVVLSKGEIVARLPAGADAAMLEQALLNAVTRT